MRATPLREEIPRDDDGAPVQLRAKIVCGEMPIDGGIVFEAPITALDRTFALYPINENGYYPVSAENLCLN